MKRYVFKDINGINIADFSPLQLPIKSDVIINKSIELFNDKEPCIIHRTYVIKKLMLEIDTLIEELYGKDSMMIKIDKGILWDYIDIPLNTAYINIYC
jgi:hypothetical protein